MKRNQIIDINKLNRLQQHKQCIAYHEAGHAVAIHLNNKNRNLPPVFFQIMFKDLSGAPEFDVLVHSAPHDDSIARVEGGRLIENLPYSVDGLARKLIDKNEAMTPLVNDYLNAFEADIINLLIGPLAEARHVYSRDDELFNHKLLDLKSLKNYGGDSDLTLAREYLESYSECKQQQEIKLNEMFDEACKFISDESNWKAISKLANYILESNKNIIRCEEIVSLLQS